MEPTVSLDGVGIRFRVSRRNRRQRGQSRRHRWMMWGLRDLTFDIAAGEIVGVIGPNGAGKSTLIRTIAGIYEPDEGTLVTRGRVAPLVTPSGGLKPGLSGWDNVELSAVLLGLARREVGAVREQVAEVAGLGDFMDAPVRVYSAGMKARLGFALAVASEPAILVLDEVMAVGDETFRERSEETLRAFIRRGGTVLFATHEVQTVAETCSRLIRLDAGRVVADGEPAPIAEAYLAEAHQRETTGGPRGRRRALAHLIRSAGEDDVTR